MDSFHRIVVVFRSGSSPTLLRSLACKPISLLMESFHRTVACLAFLLSVLLPFSSSFTPEASIFLNCGSTSSVYLSDDLPPRNFTSDSKYIFHSQASSLTNTNSSSPSPLYTSARVFTSSFSYNFTTLVPKSSNILRLHFFPFANLSSAWFNVTALNQYLLSNFSVSTASSSTIKEFFLRIDSENLELKFSPQPNSFAFISAIEVFTAPSDLLSEPGPTIIGSAALNGDLENQAMETIHRVNMGGPLVTPENDTLWRTWVPDDNFLFDKSFSSSISTPPSNLIYSPSGFRSSEEIGPESVYDTARVLNVTNETLFNVNLTWSFEVDVGYNYLVRMHFCDFISSWFSRTQGLIFTVYIMNSLALPNNLRPAIYTTGVSQPFYIDFVVYIQEFPNITVSIRLNEQSGIKSALLNGLEIMKMTKSFLSFNGTYNHSSSENNSNFSSSGNNEKKKISVGIILGATIGSVILVFIVVCSTIILCRSRKPEQNEEETPWFPCTTAINLGLIISFEQIKLATDNFDENNLIGEGGFGKVYKGVLNDGTRVAVKRASSQSNQGFPQFQTEIEILSQVRHRHLVSLVGYCEENSEMILVYEYMEKGTLRNHLYGSNLPSLSWKQRLKICIGAAKGLHYLHSGHSRNIIHRDVKSTNILLGQDFLAKVSDFGISKLGPSSEETHVSTTVKGSFGYFDLEYFKTQKLTDKSDVYSFGVVLLEVLCARPVIDRELAREQVNLAEWAIKWQKKGELEKIIDPKLVGEINENSLKKFGEIVEKCLQQYGVDRPAMKDVLWNLEYCLQLQETEEMVSGTAEVDFSHVPVVRKLPSSVTSCDAITGDENLRTS